MRIEVLYFDGCPGHERLMARLAELVASIGVETAIDLVAVESLEDAERQRFLGSPTLRVDSVDVDPTAIGRRDYGLKCRIYRIDGSQQTLPSDEWILAALRNARASERYEP